LWCRRAEVKALWRETNGTPLLTCLPSFKRCYTLPELKRGKRIVGESLDGTHVKTVRGIPSCEQPSPFQDAEGKGAG